VRWGFRFETFHFFKIINAKDVNSTGKWEQALRYKNSRWNGLDDADELK
jgi:hypothetical protein